MEKSPQGRIKVPVLEDLCPQDNCNCDWSTYVSFVFREMETYSAHGQTIGPIMDITEALANAT